MPDNYTLFHADDDDDDRFLLQQALNEVSNQQHLISASNGDAVLSLLITAADLPHLIILDINMPGKNGLICLEEIRGIERFNSTPVVIFSTSTEEKQVKSAFIKGADYYVKKPSTYSGLKKTALFFLEICRENRLISYKKELVKF